MRLSCARLLAAALACSCPAAAQAQLQLDEDFESGSLSGWQPSGNDTAAIVGSPVRAGSGAVHTHLGPTDADPKRTEITAGTGGQLLYDQEYWIGFSVNVTRWDAPLPSWATLFQFHAVPGNEDWTCCAGRNPFTVTASGGRLGVAVITTGFSGSCGAIADTVWSDTLQLSRWYDWVVRLKPSLTAGIVEVWLDGTKLYSRTGSNVDPVDVCGVAQEPWVYLKIGIYKEYTNTAVEDAYFDEVRIYKGTQGYDLVRPGGAVPADGGTPADAGQADAGQADATAPDATPADAGPADAAAADVTGADAGPVDAAAPDAPGADAGPVDGPPADSAADATSADGARGPGGLSGSCGCALARADAGGWCGLALLLVVWSRWARRRRPPQGSSAWRSRSQSTSGCPAGFW